MFRWTRRKQFWKTWRKISADSPESFRSNCSKNIVFFEKLQSVSLNTYNAVLTKLQKNFSWKSLKSKFSLSLSEIIFPDCFVGHAGSSLYNADKNLSLTVGKNFAKRAKNENFTKITFSVRILLWICSLQFYNSAGSSSLEVRKSKERNKVFLKKNFFLDFFFWTCRMQLDDSAEKLPPKLRKKIKNTVFLRWEYFPSTNSSGHVECSFENLDEKLHQKSKTFFPQVLKNFVQIQVLSQRNYFLQNVSLDT